MIEPHLLGHLRAALPPEALLVGEALADRTEDWMRRQPMRAPLVIRPSSTDEVCTALALRSWSLPTLNRTVTRLHPSPDVLYTWSTPGIRGATSR